MLFAPLHLKAVQQVPAMFSNVVLISSASEEAADMRVVSIGKDSSARKVLGK